MYMPTLIYEKRMKNYISSTNTAHFRYKGLAYIFQLTTTSKICDSLSDMRTLLDTSYKLNCTERVHDGVSSLKYSAHRYAFI